MGKKSKRDRPRTRAWKAPVTLSPDVHRAYDSEFKPIDIPKAIHETEAGQAFKGAKEDGAIQLWELGRKGTHIASRFVDCDGGEDILTAQSADDDDWEQLAGAHVCQLAMKLGLVGV